MNGPVYVYENPDAMPPAFVVACARVTNEPFAALDDLQPDVWAVIETDLGLPDCESSSLEWEVTMEDASPPSSGHDRGGTAAFLVFTELGTRVGMCG